MDEIKISGARIHNLKNINLSIPKHKLVVITGISGSGKSSLAFDIIFEEGKNQYLNSIGILAGLDKEERFTEIEGLGPAVAIRQNTIRQSNMRSTVGSKTQLLNQLALLFAGDGRTRDKARSQLAPGAFLPTTADGMCISCQGRGFLYEVNQKNLVPDETKTLSMLYEKLSVTSGFMRLLQKRFGKYLNIPFWQLPEDIREEVIYGTYENGKQSYCIERILRTAYEKGEDVERIYEKAVCPDCQGERVADTAREIYLHGKRIGELGQMTLTELSHFLTNLPKEELSVFGRKIVGNILSKLGHLIQFRLGHLTLYREIASLSGGELQRVFLHLHLESRLDSLIYVFDEPMAGLHPSEKQSMMEAVKELRDLGNTVIIVEHDKEMISHADYVIEIGPKAGVDGGTIAYRGDYEGYQNADTLLSRYLFGKCMMPSQTIQKKSLDFEDAIVLEYASTHYLKNLTVTFPLHCMVGIAGLSGSGKSSLIEATLLKRMTSAKKHGECNGIKGTERIRGFATISQEPIGRSSSSTPASYIGVWDKIRELFANTKEAKERKMSAGHFSFRSKGACTNCGGVSYEKIYLTADFFISKCCPVCHGKRFSKDSLSIRYKEKTINDVLQMSISAACEFFSDQHTIEKPLRMLERMGMGYLTLGQPSTSLSGGEAQRVKLAKELGRQTCGNLLYVLDEPTTGLSRYDTALLLRLLDDLVTNGNSVIVIEHNTDVLRCCDYILELGPEGGEKGGNLIASGTPNELKKNPNSITGRYLL